MYTYAYVVDTEGLSKAFWIQRVRLKALAFRQPVQIKPLASDPRSGVAQKKKDPEMGQKATIWGH